MNSVERLRQEFDRLIETAMDQGGRALELFGVGPSGKLWVPPVDVVETPQEILVSADLPGVDPGMLEVTLAGNMLTLQGGRPEYEAGQSETVHRRERVGGSFTRSIPLPAPVNPETVSAEAREGVVFVRLMKSEQAKPRHIKIRTEAEGQPEGGQASDNGTV